MAYNKSELEELSIKYLGKNHAELTVDEKFKRLNIPLDSELEKKARESYDTMSAEQINESLYHLLLAAEAVPEVLRLLREAKARRK